MGSADAGADGAWERVAAVRGVAAAAGHADTWRCGWNGFRVSALRIASWLAERPGVIWVHYPGLAEDRWHAAAARQFTGGFGGMVSFEMASEAGAKAVVAGLLVFRRGTSLGSTESLVEHRLTTEGPGSACPPGLVRLSVGLEDAGALVEDLEQAIAQAV